MKKCTLIPTVNNIWRIKENSEIDLMYSEDDNAYNGKGWYFSNQHTTSQSFFDKYSAIYAYKHDKLLFD